MRTKPKVKTNLSTLDKVLELASPIPLIGLLVLSLYAFIKCPKIIPVHYNVFGKADGYGNKVNLLISPVLAAIIYFGLTELNNHLYLVAKRGADAE